MSPSESDARQRGMYGKHKRLKTLIYAVLGLLCWGIFVAVLHPNPNDGKWVLSVICGFGATWFISLAILTHKPNFTRMSERVDESDS